MDFGALFFVRSLPHDSRFVWTSVHDVETPEAAIAAFRQSRPNDTFLGMTKGPPPLDARTFCAAVAAGIPTLNTLSL